MSWNFFARSLAHCWNEALSPFSPHALHPDLVARPPFAFTHESLLARHKWHTSTIYSYPFYFLIIQGEERNGAIINRTIVSSLLQRDSLQDFHYHSSSSGECLATLSIHITNVSIELVQCFSSNDEVYICSTTPKSDRFIRSSYATQPAGPLRLCQARLQALSFLSL